MKRDPGVVSVSKDWLAELEAHSANLEAEVEVAEARITELEAELAAEKRRHRDTLGLWSASVATVNRRPDDLVTIDGKRWRLINPVISNPRYPASRGQCLLRARVEPVE